MTIVRTVLALLVATLVVVTFGFAGEAHEKKVIKLMLDSDSEPFELDITELEVGESRQLFDEEGREVLVTRLEEGLEVKVDGETIEILHPGHVGIHGDHDGKRVIIKKIGEHGDDVDVDVEVLGEAHGEHSRVIVRGLGNAADRLIESGALDSLDAETRQQILDALDTGGSEGEESAAEVVIIEKKIAKKKVRD